MIVGVTGTPGSGKSVLCVRTITDELGTDRQREAYRRSLGLR